VNVNECVSHLQRSSQATTTTQTPSPTQTVYQPTSVLSQNHKSQINRSQSTQHKNVHLRRPRHRRQNRAPQPSSPRLVPSRPRRRMSAADETILALPENRPRGQFAGVQGAEQRLPQLSHGEGSNGAGRDEEFGVC